MKVAPNYLGQNQSQFRCLAGYGWLLVCTLNLNLDRTEGQFYYCCLSLPAAQKLTADASGTDSTFCISGAGNK